MLTKIYLFLFLKSSQGSEKHFSIFQVSFLSSSRRSHQRCSIKKLFLKSLQYSWNSTSVGVSWEQKLGSSTISQLGKPRLPDFFTLTPCSQSQTFLTFNFCRTEDMLLPEQRWKKERTNFRKKFCQCND